MSYETENWPYIEARWYGPKRSYPPDWIVIHDMEFPERMDAAEAVARYFKNPGNKPDGTPKKVSAHICVDADSIVQCVKDSYVAYAAPGANHNGIQIEFTGFAAQTIKQWMDEYGWMMLNRGADAVAQYCLKYSIPIRKLAPTDLRAVPRQRGICGHWDVTKAFGLTSHTDPGRNFPWKYFITAVETFFEIRK